MSNVDEDLIDINCIHISYPCALFDTCPILQSEPDKRTRGQELDPSENMLVLPIECSFKSCVLC